MQDTLIETVHALQQDENLTVSSVHDHLGVSLIRTEHNQSYVFYQAENDTDLPFELRDVELRVPRPENSTGSTILVLSTGGCISLDAVRAKYDGLAITQVPSGRSVNEKTVYTLKDSISRVSFGFTERNPDCLASVSIEKKTRSSS